MQPLLRVSNLSHAYGSHRVLAEVSLTIDAGRIVGLIGENGAGKSTLVKAILGLIRPTLGRIERLTSVAAIHQELNLADGLSVTANLFLGRELRTRFGRLDHRRMEQAAGELFERLQVTVDPTADVATLSASQRQWVEIARALSNQARLLILDEPTALLNRNESEQLFAIMRELRAGGGALLFISHKLDEVAMLSDELIVLRDGRVVSSGPATLTPQEMARRMVGREVADLYPPHPGTGGEVVLRLEEPAGTLLELHRGELLGVAGLAGNGQEQCGAALAGFLPLAGRQLEVGGTTGTTHLKRSKITPLAALALHDRQECRSCLAHHHTASSARRAGIGYLPADRLQAGIWRDFTVAEHIGLGALERFTRWGVLQQWAIREAARHAITTLKIKCNGSESSLATLSGGNQQKVALAKVLAAAPRILICNEPTQGVDIGARQDIYAHLAELARTGMAILLISSDMQELIGLCRRIVVFRNGRIAGTLSGSAISEEEIIYLATGVKSSADAKS